MTVEGTSPSEMVSSARRRRRIAGLASALTAAVILLLLRCGPEEQLPTGLAGAPTPSALSGVGAPPPDGEVGDRGAIAPVAMRGAPASDAGASAVGPVATGPAGRATAAGERIEIGRVAAVRGAAAAGPPGAPLRPLECGDPVFAGEHAYTASESRLGVLSGDVYIQLDADTELALALTDAGALDLRLEGGQARIVDARSSGPAGRLAVMGAEVALLDSDAEARLDAEDGRKFGMLCARGGALQVERNGAQMEALPGECVVVRSQLPLLAANAPEPVAFPQSAEEECRRAEVIGELAERFTPFDVAAASLVEPFLPPEQPGPPDRLQCGQPAGPCLAGASGSGPGGGGGGSGGGGGGGGGGGPPGPPPPVVKPPKGNNGNAWALGPLVLGPPPPKGPRPKAPHQGPIKTAKKPKKGFRPPRP